MAASAAADPRAPAVSRTAGRRPGPRSPGSPSGPRNLTRVPLAPSPRRVGGRGVERVGTIARRHPAKGDGGTERRDGRTGDEPHRRKPARAPSPAERGSLPAESRYARSIGGAAPTSGRRWRRRCRSFVAAGRGSTVLGRGRQGAGRAGPTLPSDSVVRPTRVVPTTSGRGARELSRAPAASRGSPDGPAARATVGQSPTWFSQVV